MSVGSSLASALGGVKGLRVGEEQVEVVGAREIDGCVEVEVQIVRLADATHAQQVAISARWGWGWWWWGGFFVFFLIGAPKALIGSSESEWRASGVRAPTHRPIHAPQRKHAPKRT